MTPHQKLATEDCVRIARKFDSAKVVEIIYDEMRLWDQCNERGALGVLLGRLIESNRVAEGGRLVKYPTWLIGGNLPRKRKRGRSK